MKNLKHSRHLFAATFLLVANVFVLSSAGYAVDAKMNMLQRLDKACIHLGQMLFTGKKSSVSYWEKHLDRQLVPGEILQSTKIGSNTFVYRFDGTKIIWDYYRITGRGVVNTAAFYPKKYFTLDFFKGKKILDVGSGRGKLVEGIRAKLLKAGIEPDVHGLDIESNPNTVGKDYFHKKDVTDTGFKNEEFDHILSTWSLFSYEQNTNPVFIAKALKELNRITKKGGLILLSPVSPKLFRQYAAEEKGLEVLDSGWQRRIQPDIATLLTVGQYVVLRKSE